MRKKDNSIILRLRQEDKSFLSKQAKKHKMSLSRYVRTVVTNTFNQIEE